MKYESLGQIHKAEGLRILESKKQKALEARLLPDILDLLETPEYKIGQGGTASAFYPKKGNKQVCYKIYHRELVAYAKEERDVPEQYREAWSKKENRSAEEIPWRVSGRRELEITDQLRNLDPDVGVPNVYMYHELKGDETGEKYWIDDTVEVLVMQRIMNAVDLEQLIHQKKNLPPNFDLDKFIKKLENFFKKMHERGIFHRDVAPRNIMIDLETSRPYVIDFGRATDHVLSDESPYEQEIVVGGNVEKIIFAGTDESGLEGIRAHLSAYQEYMKGKK